MADQTSSDQTSTDQTSSDQTSTAATEAGYRGPQVCEIVGITYRQLDYWARTDLVRPSLAEANGSGSKRAYSYRDLVVLKVIKSLLDAGLSLQAVRGAVEYLRHELGADVASARLVISPGQAALVHGDGEMVDLIQKGQGVFNIVPLHGVVEELDAAICELHPAPMPATPADSTASDSSLAAP